MDDEIKRIIGERFRDLRMHKGISLRQFAIDADFHPNVLSRIERGEHNVTIETLMKLCRSLDVAPAEILRGIK